MNQREIGILQKNRWTCQVFKATIASTVLLFSMVWQSHAYVPVVLARWSSTLGTGAPVEVQLSRDGGATWELRGCPCLAQPHGDMGLGISAIPPGSLYVVAFTDENLEPSLYFSPDTGTTWVQRARITTGTGLPDRCSAGIAIAGARMYVYVTTLTSSDAITVYESVNGGFNWSLVSTFPIPFLGGDPEGEMVPVGSDTLYIAEWCYSHPNPVAYISSTAGTSWSLTGVISGDTSGPSKRSVAIAYTGKSLLASTWSELCPLKAYSSVDQAATWTLLDTITEPMPQEPVEGCHSMCFGADGYAYVAAWHRDINTQVFRSCNVGSTWVYTGDIPPHPHEYFTAVSITSLQPGPTGVESEENKADVCIRSVFPNPTIEGTSIRYTVREETSVRIHIYDVSGKLVRNLLCIIQPAGSYSSSWDGKDDSGAKVNAGVYFCRIELGYVLNTRKITLLR